MPKQTIHNCKDELRDVDLKATPTRIAVLKLLEEIDRPIDAMMIMDYLTQKEIHTDPATVFRMLNQFTEKGITKQVQLNEGKFRYELASKDDHHHLICELCGSIEDISDCNIRALEKDINAKKQFLVKRHALEFFGVCKQCQQ